MRLLLVCTTADIICLCLFYTSAGMQDGIVACREDVYRAPRQELHL